MPQTNMTQFGLSTFSKNLDKPAFPIQSLAELLTWTRQTLAITCFQRIIHYRMEDNHLAEMQFIYFGGGGPVDMGRELLSDCHPKQQ